MTTNIKKITNAKDLENFIKNNDFHTILMDADGCICNFNLEYYLRTGMKAEDDPAKVWDIFIPWVSRGFFCTLLPIRPTVSLTLKLKREGYDVQILTACGSYSNRSFKDIKNQKKYWCTKYLPEIPQRFVENGTDKKYFGKDKKVLLVDDQLNNVVCFRDYGGEAVHYVPDYSYPEENQTTTLEEEISELHEALDTAELENAELKNPIYTEEKMRGIISDWNDKQWKQYCNDERVW